MVGVFTIIFGVGWIALVLGVAIFKDQRVDPEEYNTRSKPQGKWPQ